MSESSLTNFQGANHLRDGVAEREKIKIASASWQRMPHDGHFSLIKILRG
jgi:hypothetical protein